jgi:hypothetical protein
MKTTYQGGCHCGAGPATNIAARLSDAQSPARAATGTTHELGKALMWGTVIVAVLLGVVAAAYSLIQSF